MSYTKFRQDLINSNCQKCPELCKQRKNIVADRGNPNTDIVIIGEGPGAQEDASGFAFVGQAGKMLDKIMAAIGLDTNKDLLILNVVKCRPPGNRAPLLQEAENCMPYLKKALTLVKPRVILLLGATAAKYFLNLSGSMKQNVGKFYEVPEYPGIKFMLLYHPAALLYDVKKKKDMWMHVKKLKRYLEV